MGTGASSEGAQGVSDAEKIAMYDKLAAKMPELVATKAIDQNQIEVVLNKKSELPAVTPTSKEAQAITTAPVNRRRSGQAAEGQSNDSVNVEELFANFCSIYRSDAMTNTIFAKFCNDSKLVDKKFPKPSIDMVWSKCAGKEKKVSSVIFKRMLEEIAKAKNISYESLLSHLANNAQVKNSGTVGQSRFYDDKNSWTGVACKGGPSAIDHRTSLSDLADRDNKADVRGVIQP